MGAKLNIDLYRRAYFYFDKSVDYVINDKILYIHPVLVKDSEIFLSSVPVLDTDKNSSDSVEIIQMSYLDFIYKILFQDEINISRFINILRYCLHIENPEIGYDENQKPFLKDKDTGIVIKSKDFENIRRLILYQNLVHYDDEYINPEIKKMMAEVDAVKNSSFDLPNIERKMAIISAHNGMTKKEQMDMTYRSHSILFEEVYGEVEFMSTRAMRIYAGKDGEMEHWIYKKKKDKYAGYMTDADTYAKSMGGDKNAIKSSSGTEYGDNLSRQYDNFTNK